MPILVEEHHLIRMLAKTYLVTLRNWPLAYVLDAGSQNVIVVVHVHIHVFSFCFNVKIS